MSEKPKRYERKDSEPTSKDVLLVLDALRFDQQQTEKKDLTHFRKSALELVKSSLKKPEREVTLSTITPITPDEEAAIEQVLTEQTQNLTDQEKSLLLPKLRTALYKESEKQRESILDFGNSAHVAIDILKSADKLGITQNDRQTVKPLYLKSLENAIKKQLSWMVDALLKGREPFQITLEECKPFAESLGEIANTLANENKTMLALNQYDIALQLGANPDQLFISAESFKKMADFAITSGRIEMAVKMATQFSRFDLPESAFHVYKKEALRRMQIEAKASNAEKVKAYIEQRTLLGLTDDDIEPFKHLIE